MADPATQAEARELALRYVRTLMGRGYTPDRAAAEVHCGWTEPGEPGYFVSHGKITVPSWRMPRWTFSYAALYAEPLHPADPGQMVLF